MGYLGAVLQVGTGGALSPFIVLFFLHRHDVFLSGSLLAESPTRPLTQSLNISRFLGMISKYVLSRRPIVLTNLSI